MHLAVEPAAIGPIARPRWPMSLRRSRFSAFAAGNAGFQHFGIVQRIPHDLSWCRNAPLAGHVHRIRGPVARGGRYLQGHLHATKRDRGWRRAAAELIWAAPLAGCPRSLSCRRSHRVSGITGWDGWSVWSLALLLPAIRGLGRPAAAGAWHAILMEYLPFVTLLLVLFTTGGGVLVRGGVSGTPAGNTGCWRSDGLAGVMGHRRGDGADPSIAARQRAPAAKAHLALIFILLVAMPAEPCRRWRSPLYLGSLQGVPFFWPLQTWLRCTGGGGACWRFLAADAALAGARARAATEPLRSEMANGWGCCFGSRQCWCGRDVGVMKLRQRIGGGSGLWAWVCSWRSPCLGVADTAIHSSRERFFLAPDDRGGAAVRGDLHHDRASTAPAGSGNGGPFAPLLRLLTDADGAPLPAAYFWVTGGVSAFLDNAPSYLVFFEMAGIRPETLNSVRSLELEAISAGAVFFGALTYIGNAPNMMVRAIAAHRGMRMPGFFGF